MSDRIKTEGYPDRERMYRGVENSSDEGWVAQRITSLGNGGYEVQYQRKTSIVDAAPQEQR